MWSVVPRPKRVRGRRKWHPKGKGKGKRNGKMSQSMTKRQKRMLFLAYLSKQRCYNCGQMGHLSRKCPTGCKGPKCFQCNEFGHKARNCNMITKPPRGYDLPLCQGKNTNNAVAWYQEGEHGIRGAKFHKKVNKGKSRTCGRGSKSCKWAGGNHKGKRSEKVTMRKSGRAHWKSKLAKEITMEKRCVRSALQGERRLRRRFRFHLRSNQQQTRRHDNATQKKQRQKPRHTMSVSNKTMLKRHFATTARAFTSRAFASNAGHQAAARIPKRGWFQTMLSLKAFSGSGVCQKSSMFWRRKDRAATLIQCFIRMKMVQKRMIKDRAATLIQCFIRMNMVQKRMIKDRATTLIQCFIRMKIAQKRMVACKGAALVIQCFVRLTCARQQLHHLARIRVAKKQRAASIVIQRCVRMHLARKLKKWFRKKLERNKVKDQRRQKMKVRGIDVGWFRSSLNRTTCVDSLRPRASYGDKDSVRNGIKHKLQEKAQASHSGEGKPEHSTCISVDHILQRHRTSIKNALVSRQHALAL